VGRLRHDPEPRHLGLFRPLNAIENRNGFVDCGIAEELVPRNVLIFPEREKISWGGFSSS